MQCRNLLASTILAISALTMSMSASAQEELTGDEGLACQALLCLASGTQPAECAPSLARYFSISFRFWSDTLQGRLNFLSLCPVSSQTPEMQSFVSAVANGAGRCDPGSLNTEMLTSTGGDSGYSYIDSQLPGYCSVYLGSQYADLSSQIPRYVGDPMRGGQWVAASDYDAALAAYNARIAAENAALLNDTGGGG